MFEFAQRHDARIWQQLCKITGIDEGAVPTSGSIVAPQLGRVGIWTSVAAHWASWADAVGMIQNRHPTIAATIVRVLEVGSPVPAITLTPTDQAMLRSKGGPLAAAPFLALPTSRLTKLDPSVFRTLLVRRLRLPLPLTMRACGCGRLLDAFGHHRSACAVSGVLGRRGFALLWLEQGRG